MIAEGTAGHWDKVAEGAQLFLSTLVKYDAQDRKIDVVGLSY